MAGGNWRAKAGSLRRDLGARVDRATLRRLHRASGVRHGLVAARQFLLAGVAGWAIVQFSARPAIWVPAALLLGFVLFSFTVLLHEVVHGAVFRRRHRRADRLLAWLYALPSGLSPSQFARWHLDHHAELGTSDRDPKRCYLTPSGGGRLRRLLYLTPALFPIYFRAAARAAARYPEALRRRLVRERRAVHGMHLIAMAAIAGAFGFGVLLQLYVLPVFFVFPVAFTINRLGQHYDIDPSDPAAWGTLVRTNPVWNFLFLWSSFHMEHHYFPKVPFYNLPALHRALQPVFSRHPMRVRTYTGLLVDWFLRGRTPHTAWE